MGGHSVSELEGWGELKPAIQLDADEHFSSATIRRRVELFERLRAFVKQLSTSQSPPLDHQTVPNKKAFELPPEMLWLLDAPLFIDALQVEAFYDAILRPDYEGTSVTLSRSITSETTFGGQTTVGAQMPWVGKAEVTLSGERKHLGTHGQDMTLTPISNSYRHLLAVALHYAVQPRPNRLVIASPATDRSQASNAGRPKFDWLDPLFVEAVPRALVFLDMEPGSKFIPAALELSNGEVHVLADKLGTALKRGSEVPKYGLARQGEYFTWFFERFDDRKAIDTIEKTVKGEPIVWIDYNVSLAPNNPSPFMHLHLMGRGKYPTGAFAYNFVTRGFKYGLRIVGTLKSGPDLNVLAVFER